LQIVSKDVFDFWGTRTLIDVASPSLCPPLGLLDLRFVHYALVSSKAVICMAFHFEDIHLKVLSEDSIFDLWDEQVLFS
tara:strand:+ start:98 stop:334 length:237 start_codon:yes stop_codon:yes gene_type:complete